MSAVLSPEQIAHIRNDARLLASSTRSHIIDAEALVALAERALRATDGVTVSLDTPHDEITGRVTRATECWHASRQLHETAGQLHAVAARMRDCVEGMTASRHPGATQPEAVLVVDDYPGMRNLLATTLRDAGFVVATAGNGLEALVAACELRPGVIVMDVTMPVLDGIEATRLIKANHSTSRARVIAYTGEPVIDERLGDALFVAVVQKPADPEVVLAAVQRASML